MIKIRKKTIRTWEKLNEAYAELSPSTQWFYRGQRDARWGLEPSLERTLRRFRIPLSELRNYETRLLRQFIRNFHRYSSYLPDDHDTIEWLTYMQHHGTPTRLLDWTYSFHVALFFAIESAEIGTTCTVWIVNNDFLVAERNAGFSRDELALYRKNDKDVQLAQKLLDNEADSIIGANPLRLNERLAVQQGAFLLSRRTTKPFEETLGLLGKKNPDAFLRLDIICSRKLILKILGALHRMNIGRVSLFPGIDGFAQSLTNQVPLEFLWKWT